MADAPVAESGPEGIAHEEGGPAPSPPASPTHIFFACRRCRAKLFDASELVPHDPADGAKRTFKYRRGGQQQQQDDGVALSEEDACTSYFLDPDQTPWVSEEIREANAAGLTVEPDTIYCPNVRCRAKLGTQSWTGSQCSCGAWITPAFRIHARAVDKIKEF